MALQPTRYDFRVSLSHVDRGIERAESVLVARHPSETQAHTVLRVLGWCLFNEEGLAFGPGLSTPEAADLHTHDATGRLTTWVECGAVSAERLRKVQQHNSHLAVHVLLDDEKRARELAAELAATKLPRAATPPALWVVDAALLRELAAREERRQRWSVTIVGDHLYLDADGRALDGALTRIAG